MRVFICSVVACFFLFLTSAFAVAPADGSFYLSCSSVQLGEVVVYVPITSNFNRRMFGVRNGQPVNITSSTISGYIYDGSGSLQYNVRFPVPFGTAEYRSSDSSYYEWQSLDLSIVDTNFDIVENSEELRSDQGINISIVALCFLGVIVLCLFIKRF